MTKKKRKYFGTDGIRGRVGSFPITPEFVLKLGWAAGKVLCCQKDDCRVLIGKDTRVSGYMFESALEAGLSAAGANIYLLGPIPTPAVAFLTRDLRAQLGIVISASHNPYYDNGIKFFLGNGQKLPDEIELQIEQQIDETEITIDGRNIGKVKRIDDASTRYVEFCKKVFPAELSLRGIRLVIDCANGADYDIGPKVFHELGAEVLEIGGNPDGFNINEFCGATDLKRLQKVVLAEQADFGIALDGDGDRLMMVDHKGEIVDGDEIIFIIARYLHENSKLTGGVVGTEMSNFGLEQAFNQLKIPFIRSKVGDRYVMEGLLKRNWMLGGESSGHIIHLDSTTTGDGIISALLVLTAMVISDKSLHELKSGMQKMPQKLINVKVADKTCVNAEAVQNAQKIAQQKLKDTGRVLLRSSGTEPVVRVMVEGQDVSLVNKIASELAQKVSELAH
ncbi:MAG: phosphoglucosamine mutase [Gammaproteobacteria bacterium]|jgi:phosphoglucosamine mutase